MEEVIIERESDESVNFIEKFIMYILIFNLLFERWMLPIDLSKYIYLVIGCYIAYQYLIRGIKVTKGVTFMTLASVIIISMNIMLHGCNSSFMSSLIMYGIGNSVIIIFFIYMISYKEWYINNFFINKVRKIFNVYFIINIPIILRQLNNTYFLMRFYDNNPMYEDHITGLIGSSGTHRLTLYWIALVVMNISYYMKERKKSTLYLMIFQIIFMVVISAQNDNTCFYLLFPLIVIQVIIYYGIKEKASRFKSIIVLLGIIVSLCYIISSNSEISEFLNTRVKGKVLQLTGNIDQYDNRKEEEERIELFKYSLSYGNGYTSGMGIGTVKYADPTMPSHFGMSEISIKVYEGGIVYFSYLIILYSYLLFHNFSRKNLLVFLLIVINLTILAFYTQVFKCSQLIIPLIFICLSLRNSKEEEGVVNESTD